MVAPSEKTEPDTRIAKSRTWSSCGTAQTMLAVSKYAGKVSWKLRNQFAALSPPTANCLSGWGKVSGTDSVQLAG